MSGEGLSDIQANEETFFARFFPSRRKEFEFNAPAIGIYPIYRLLFILIFAMVCALKNSWKKGREAWYDRG